MGHTRDRLEAIVTDALAAARARGAGAASVRTGNVRGLAVRVRLGEVESLEQHLGQSLGITVYFGQRRGSVTTSEIEPKAVREAIDAACSIARHTADDPFSGLADADRMARGVAELELFHPWQLTAEAAIDVARRCEQAAREEDAGITNSEGARISSYETIHAYGNTHGFVGSYTGTRHDLGCTVIGGTGNTMQRDGWFTRGRDPNGLEGAESVGRTAARRTIRRLGARPLATRRAPVLFDASVATSLLGHFVGAIHGSALYRKASFLLDGLGEQIFPPFVHIHEQPFLPGALGSVPFDREGVAPMPRDIVRDGVLRSYILDSYAARRLGMETTGNAGGIHNLCIDPGERNLEGLLAELHTGLLVTELMGQGVNAVTGDYSRGASGFWIENGEVRFAVEQITVAGNLRQMFADLVAIGSDIDCRSNIRTGSLLVGSMTIAGR